MQYHIEGIKYQYGKWLIKGWAVGKAWGELPSVSIEGEEELWKPEASYEKRPDLKKAFFPEADGDGEYGFRVSFLDEGGDCPVLKLSCGQDQVRIAIRRDRLLAGEGIEEGVKELGLSGMAARLKQRVKGALKPEKRDDESFLISPTGIPSKEQKARIEQLHRQAKSLLNRPLFSIVVPVYRPEEAHLKEMLDSVRNQVYDNWELCLCEASGDGGRILNILKEYERKDSRIRVTASPENKGISANTNQAFSMARGEFTALLDHDDLLEPDALYEMARLLEKEPDLDFIYTDSDLADQDAMEFHSPLYKMGWSEETMLSANYITHFSAVRTQVMKKIGGWRTETDGAQDWDLYFRISEETERIGWIPKVLYHWRTAASSTARSVEVKPYAREAQRYAICSHLERTGRRGRVLWEEEPGRFRILWEEEPDYQVLTYEEAKRTAFEERRTGLKSEKTVWIFRKEGIEVSEAAARELSAFALLPGVGFVMPKLIAENGRIKSLGLGERFCGAGLHESNAFGSADWYRNPEAVEPDCTAISEEYLRKLKPDGIILTPEWVKEASGRQKERGFRNVMTPFAEVFIKDSI